MINIDRFNGSFLYFTDYNLQKSKREMIGRISSVDMHQSQSTGCHPNRLGSIENEQSRLGESIGTSREWDWCIPIHE